MNNVLIYHNYFLFFFGPRGEGGEGWGGGIWARGSVLQVSNLRPHMHPFLRGRDYAMWARPRVHNYFLFKKELNVISKMDRTLQALDHFFGPSKLSEHERAIKIQKVRWDHMHAYCDINIFGLMGGKELYDVVG